MMRSTRDRVIFADTGAFIALGNRRDQYHIRATRILDKLLDSPFTLITTRYVFAEAIALIRYMVGFQQAVETGNYMRDREDIEVIVPGVDTEAHAWEIFTKSPTTSLPRKKADVPYALLASYAGPSGPALRCARSQREGSQEHRTAFRHRDAQVHKGRDTRLFSLKTSYTKKIPPAIRKWKGGWADSSSVRGLNQLFRHTAQPKGGEKEKLSSGRLRGVPLSQQTVIHKK